jgi:hypothetical protein
LTPIGSHACEHIAEVIERRKSLVRPADVVGARWIPLTRERWALVDTLDFEAASAHVWFCHADGYAVTKIKGRAVKLHNFLFGPSTHRLPIDHINRNTLDNRRKNLRQVTGGQNRVNSKINSNNTSTYRGVTRSGSGWHARLGHNMCRLYLGYFSTAEAAARAYDAKAAELFGPAAQLNFPHRNRSKLDP